LEITGSFLKKGRRGRGQNIFELGGKTKELIKDQTKTKDALRIVRKE